MKKQTKPPAQHTDASLLGLMETAGKLVENEDLAEALKDRGLGTPATRAQIIEKLLERGYIEKVKKNLVATNKGYQLVDLARELFPALTSPELTGEWEAKLRRIEIGSLGYPIFMAEIREYVRASVEAVKEQPLNYTRTIAPKDAIGTCPLCGGTVVENSKGYGCSNWKSKGCRFVIWKENFGGKISKTAAKELLKTGRTKKPTKLKTRDGREYSAHLLLENGRLVVALPRSRECRQGLQSRSPGSALEGGGHA